jgi:hypothetical protein
MKLVSAEIDAYRARADDFVRDNVRSYLKRRDIERLELETYILRRFSAGTELLYTSTVPRGLAGATSDIDIMLVAPRASLGPDLLNIIFFRRPSRRREGNCRRRS